MWIGAAGAYLLLIGFFLIERLVRAHETLDMTRQSTDRGSTTFVSTAMAVALVLIPLTPLLNWWGIGTTPVAVSGSLVATSLIGTVIGLIGLMERYQAFKYLGQSFTRTLQAPPERRLVTTGSYRYVRHPGYLANLLIFLGASIAMNNLITVFIVAAAFISAYVYRIKVEEAMLVEVFGDEYRDYQKRSKRLIPWVW